MERPKMSWWKAAKVWKIFAAPPTYNLYLGIVDHVGAEVLAADKDAESRNDEALS
jgi:hypothetical protein